MLIKIKTHTLLETVGKANPNLKRLFGNDFTGSIYTASKKNIKDCVGTIFKTENLIFENYFDQQLQFENITLDIQGYADFELLTTDQTPNSATYTDSIIDTKPRDLGYIYVSNYNLTKIPPQGFDSHKNLAILSICLANKVLSPSTSNSDSNTTQFSGAADFNYYLIYLSLDLKQYKLIKGHVSQAEARRFYLNLLNKYQKVHNSKAIYRHSRNQSIANLKFPFAILRNGQKELMAMVVEAIKSELPLLVQAPTGIGKTISTLYPAIKLLPRKQEQKIFYLTAKQSTRPVVETSLKIIAQQGLVFRSLTLAPKEEICVDHDFTCNSQLTNSTNNEYKNLNMARQELKYLAHLDKTIILATATKFNLCPFELMLYMGQYVDLIIGDYNHFFDPRIRLQRFFDDENIKHILLIDEAHNLPDRTLNMYSAALNFRLIKEVQIITANYNPDLNAKFNKLCDYFATLTKALKNHSKGFDLVEPQCQSAIFMAANFRATADKPLMFIGMIMEVLNQIQLTMEGIEDIEKAAKLRKFYYDCLFFIRVSNEFWQQGYLTYFEKVNNDLFISLNCLDTSEILIESFRDRHIPIFFSATLEPLKYFRNMICGNKTLDQPLSLSLASPFPRQNLLVLEYNQLDTTYNNRQHSILEAANMVFRAVNARLGNYLVFLPSYSYLELLYLALTRYNADNNLSIIRQKPKMTKEAQIQFLANFEQPARDKSTLGLAVLGGSFSEGIDLVGDKLNGVIIIGVGLPGLSPQREILKQYYQEKLQQGYNYAYLYPGFNKVLQAAGRLIRTETDYGFILLCDQRYARPEYHELYPDNWQVLAIDSAEALTVELTNFYQEFDS